ncbi:MAG: hypothetical protein ACOYJU_00795 [Anaerovoracaceae bacterium]|jgi:hypothetical protein
MKYEFKEGKSMEKAPEVPDEVTAEKSDALTALAAILGADEEKARVLFENLKKMEETDGEK